MATMTLRPYQLECVDKLQSHRARLIADEMGVGKTVEAIALDLHHRNNNISTTNGASRPQTLVIAPLTGVIDQWEKEYAKFAPHLNVRKINPKKRDLLFHDAADVDVFIVHWEAVRLMESAFQSRHWLHIIADEAHKIKNRKTKTALALKRITNVTYKTALTGTPVMNRPDDLWSVLNWLYTTKRERDDAGIGHWHQKLLNSYWRYYERFVDYYVIEPYGYHKITGPRNTPELKKLLDELGYIRRLKKDVLADLPPKVYQTFEVELGPQQRRAYDGMKRDLIAWIGRQENQPVVAPVVIAQLIRLQQFALAYGEIEHLDTANGTTTKLNLSLPSSKLDALLDIIEDAGDKQLVVYSTSKQMINLVDEALQKAGVTTSVIHGDVPQAARNSIIERFQTGEAQVFLATIRAGGIGLNLQNADTVIFLDRDWSPAANQQAEDRVHRSGQESSSVHIIDIAAKGTIDQRKHTTIDKKWSWVREVVGA